MGSYSRPMQSLQGHCASLNLSDPCNPASMKTPLALPARLKTTGKSRNRHPAGPYSRTMPRLLSRSLGAQRFLLSEVPL